MNANRFETIAHFGKLVRLTRKAFEIQDALHTMEADAATAINYCPMCHQETARRSRHTYERYSALLDTLSDQTGLSRNFLHTQIADRKPCNLVFIEAFCAHN